MQKNWKLIAGIIAGIALLVGVWIYVKYYNNSQKWYTTFTSVDKTFSVDYPRSRQVQLPKTDQGAIVASFVTDNDSLKTTSNIKPYVNIAKGAVAGNIDDVYAQTIEKYKKLFKNVQIISEGKDRINGENARKVVFEGTLGGRKMHYVVVFIEYKQMIFTITAASAPVDAQILGKELEIILSTWKFTE